MVTQEAVIELQQYIQRVMQTEPAPPEGSNIRAVLSTALTATNALLGLVNRDVWVTFYDFDPLYKQLREQVVLADQQWQKQSGRALQEKPADPPSLAKSLSGFANVLKWGAIFAGIYFGGKLVLDIMKERRG